MRLRVLLPLAAALAVALASPAASVSAASAAPAAPVPGASHQSHAHRSPKVAARTVVFDVVNSNTTSVLCASDNRAYRLHARLVAPRSVLTGRRAVFTANVLVHDAGTGGWFWNLSRHPAYDYASQLAEHGQASIVLDRLGYDSSPLADGRATCLGAQVDMLHQVVQDLYAGIYRFDDGRTAPVPSHVVVQGHGTGATIGQVEAASYNDAEGLVLMSAPTTSPSQLALTTLGEQSSACRSHGYAAFGRTATDYRRLLFRTAPPAVQAAAVVRRNPTPCGDVASVTSAILAASLEGGRIDVPVLRLDGSADARRSTAAPALRASAGVTTRTIRGAGSALPLERSAATTRSIVLSWLRHL